MGGSGYEPLYALQQYILVEVGKCNGATGWMHMGMSWHVDDFLFISQARWRILGVSQLDIVVAAVFVVVLVLVVPLVAVGIDCCSSWCWYYCYCS